MIEMGEFWFLDFEVSVFFYSLFRVKWVLVSGDLGICSSDVYIIWKLLFFKYRNVYCIVIYFFILGLELFLNGFLVIVYFEFMGVIRCSFLILGLFYFFWVRK